MRPGTRHLLTVCAILALTTLLYSRISTSYFCGFDDFIDVHRAAADQADPIKILTTTHYNSFKYRPLNRASNLVAYLIGKNSAVPFRIRNLLFHELAIIVVYWLGLLLFQSSLAAGTATLLFAINPLVNQPIIAAVFNNTTGNALFLLSLALFIWSLQTARIARLVLALICGAVGVYFYESGIVLAGLLASWIALDYLFHRRLPSRKFLLVFFLLGGLLFGSYLGVRRYVIVGKIPSPDISRPGTVVRNVALYAAGIVVPFDPVLGADWLGTPMPKELLVSGLDSGLVIVGLFVVVGIGVMGLSLLISFVGRQRIAGWVRGLEWEQILFLLLGMGLSVLPLVLFTEHPSETYVYLPVAFYCLLLGRVLSLIPSRRVLSVVVGVFVLLYGFATWDRNQDVVRCAVTAQTILSNLPGKEWKQGPWHISVAKAPGEMSVMPYAFYNYYGLDSLGMSGYGADAIQYAMQLTFGNGQLQAEEVEPETFPSRCASLGPREACYWVHSDGRVTEFGKPLQP